MDKLYKIISHSELKLLIESCRTKKELRDRLGLCNGPWGTKKLNKMIGEFDISHFNKTKTILKKCESCETEFEVIDNDHGKSRKFCSISCSNTKRKMSDVTRKKISEKLKLPNDSLKKNKPKKCKYCGQTPCKRVDICKKYQLLPALIKYFGFDKSTIGSIEIYEEFDRVRNMLEEDYYDNNLSLLDMSSKYEHKNVRNFSKILNSLRIQRRNLSEAVSNALISKNLTLPNCSTYKSGWHTTWNGKKVFYRSSYELDYCHQLDVNKVDYEMEALRILYWDSQLNKQRIAIPDFYIKSDNLIVEVKSDFTYDEINMRDKLKSYNKHGYKLKLILDHNEYEL